MAYKLLGIAEAQLKTFFFHTSKLLIQHQQLHIIPMSHVMRKTNSCLCENKGADQLCSNCTADQHLCFCYMDSLFLLYLYTKFPAFFCDCTVQFVSGLAGNPEDQFSHDLAHIMNDCSASGIVIYQMLPSLNFQHDFHCSRFLECVVTCHSGMSS